MNMSGTAANAKGRANNERLTRKRKFKLEKIAMDKITARKRMNEGQALFGTRLMKIIIPRVRINLTLESIA